MNITSHKRQLIPTEGPGHSYSLDGRPLLGVTTVIHTVLRSPQLEEWLKRNGLAADGIRDEAAAFGKSVHAGLAAHASGNNLVPMDLPEAWEETVAAGRRWLEDNLAEIYAVEQAVALYVCLSTAYERKGRSSDFNRQVESALKITEKK